MVRKMDKMDLEDKIKSLGPFIIWIIIKKKSNSFYLKNTIGNGMEVTIWKIEQRTLLIIIIYQKNWHDLRFSEFSALVRKWVNETRNCFEKNKREEAFDVDILEEIKENKNIRRRMGRNYEG